MTMEAPAAPGRLGDPDLCVATDPRLDPRLVKVLAQFGLDQRTAPPPVAASAPREELLGFATATEEGFEAIYSALMAGLEPVPGIRTERSIITATDGHELSLYISRPDEERGPLPVLFHMHGGGMVMITASGAAYTRWREELAATGLVVVGVEFRNGAGKLGPFPFPAGLQDCADGLKWVSENLSALGGSRIVVSGDSGGANLTLALTLKAKREGFLDLMSGVYVQCPFIHGRWAEQTTELPSLRENDGYFLDCSLAQVLSEMYDPGGAHDGDATCWPSRVAVAELEGMPPHVVSVNEVDPLRDEGLEYYRKLLAAGVPTVGRLNLGLTHVAETMVRAAMPDVYLGTVRAIRDFASHGPKAVVTGGVSW